MRGDFILYPAAFYPHKNHAVLLRRVRRRRQDRTTSRWCSPERSVQAPGARRIRRSATSPKTPCGSASNADVRMRGYVTTDQLAALYGGASMLAFPSRFEGFGLPVVEAMSAGCAVIAADATALPDVVGDAGLLIDPDDDVAWGQAMAGSARRPEDPPQAGRRRPRASGRTGGCRPDRPPGRDLREGSPHEDSRGAAALPARRRADWRHRQPAGRGVRRARPSRRGGHLAALVRAPRGAARVARQDRASRRDAMGRVTRVHPFPTATSSTCRAGPPGSPRSAHSMRPSLQEAATSMWCSRCHHRCRWPRPVGSRRWPAALRWC